MFECIKCGVTEDKALLFDVISPSGIVKICRRCNVEEDLPLIKKARDIEAPEFGRESFLDKRKREFVFDKEDDLRRKEDTTLREIVDRNFEKRIPEKEEVGGDFVYNFHWIIMRARRAKKLTQSQFAEEIKEPESAIKMLEEGRVPKDSSRLILKVENYLGIKIMNKERDIYSDEIDSEKDEIKKQFEKEISFDPLTTKSLTISDLQKMKKKEDEDYSDREFLDPFSEEPLNEEDRLSKEELDRIIYGI